MGNKEQITHRLYMFVRFANSGKEKPGLLRSLTHLQGKKIKLETFRKEKNLYLMREIKKYKTEQQLQISKTGQIKNSRRQLPFKIISHEVPVINKLLLQNHQHGNHNHQLLIFLLKKLSISTNIISFQLGWESENITIQGY